MIMLRLDDSIAVYKDILPLTIIIAHGFAIAYRVELCCSVNTLLGGQWPEWLNLR